MVLAAPIHQHLPLPVSYFRHIPGLQFILSYAHPLSSPNLMPFHLPTTATPEGDLYIFGGSVDGVPRNDIYLLSTCNHSVSLFQTDCDVPSPRVGHACALFSNFLVVWGGDTRFDPFTKEKLDEDIYLLDLASKKWTRVTIDDPVPMGRYGHTVTVWESKLFLFGGWQVEGGFSNDLWSLDLDARYIPQQRHGHAAALVDDIIYIFGGRDMNGKDLQDLCAFKISDQLWYTFQNVGPTPSGRSGHAMVAVNSKVCLLGGESLSQETRDGPTIVHVLNTYQIKYPLRDRGPLPRDRLTRTLSKSNLPANPLTIQPVKPVIVSAWRPDSNDSSNMKAQTLKKLRRFGLVEDEIQQVPSFTLAEGEPSESSTHISDEHSDTLPVQWNQRHQFTDENLKLIDRIQAVLTDKQEYKKLLVCKGNNAQILLDVFQRLLDIATDLSPDFWRSLIVATQRLAASSGLYPSYELTGITTSDISEYSGGFADVYKGDFHGRAVSLKTVRLHRNTQMAHFVKVVSREVILWGQLHYPNVLPFYGIYRFKSWLSLIAPWMDNGDIGMYLKHHRNSNRVVLAYDVAQGLNFLHKNKIIHGDLKGTKKSLHGRHTPPQHRREVQSDGKLQNSLILKATSKNVTPRQATSTLGLVSLMRFAVLSRRRVIMLYLSNIKIFTGEIPLAHLIRDATIIKQVSEGERPARPPIPSPSWIVWGLTNSIWVLMQICWSAHPGERPTAHAIIDQLAPALPPNSEVETSNSLLSSKVFREMARGSSDDDLMSIETFESLLVPE
ncbi:hypothetical protein C0995_007705 [Termitomyces sp. Mi166|nr:hypothetical protein C0995_007705 [Termitomyces sp. Mi166\